MGWANTELSRHYFVFTENRMNMRMKTVCGAPVAPSLKQEYLNTFCTECLKIRNQQLG
ncbi:hypothetical protein BI084_gp63 [Gordonia phage Terapin]|uniref:Uncharacterized protein n=5 Tax=Terapinvirus terapin TaxID=2734283 RepID=A0A345MBA2_9CAUD|nr:hypothetical protein BI084_gp63 [Gordonia phage Terapin]AVP43339.1 hypothetical protein PBI_DJOKOVIC_62 [Gordonia phage Djokovic]AXH67773.1 hypothetical protein SEA_BEYONCAGE_62 [Gordonia phage Beyoncage]QOC56207.1 hypothetical protein SEA_SIENNA_62 [Gordonia phage Sienna]QOC56632.1 hypothetical protein SEA_BITESIZE_62 [Gordonia phage BiteSize]QYW00865.1 hypothetical protein SEA_MADI_62 [Gordonia phage Madi]